MVNKIVCIFHWLLKLIYNVFLFHFQANAIINSLVENERIEELGKVVVDEVFFLCFLKQIRYIIKVKWLNL